jgi:Ran GTPase-activating protein (RanGAP) involved in mRNA processing and transport
VHCIETFNDENVKSLCTILLENPAHTNVETLSLPRNELALDAAQAIARLLYANATIQHLNLSDNSLGYQGAQALVQPLLYSNTTLVSLDLTHNDLGPRGSESVATLLARTTALRELRLGNNHFGSRGIRVLAPKLTACKSLLHLDLSHNQLGSQGIHLLGTQLLRTLLPPLLYLDVTGNRACETGARALTEWLVKNKTCETLILNSNDIGPMGAASLSTALKCNHTLLHLQMRGNQIDNYGATALAKALQRPQELQASCLQSQACLQTLKLDWNRISSQGAQALGEALMSNASLAELDLSCNQIEDAGGVALAKALPFNITLTSLNLSRNKMSDTAALAFADALVGVNRNLITLALEDNRISENGVAQIQHCFRYRDNYKVWFECLLKQQLRNLRILSLLSRHIGDEEVIALAPKLGNTLLRALYIGGKLITTRGILSLARQYLSNESCQLQRLHINNTCMGNDGAQGIADAKNRSLRVLSIPCSGVTAAGAKALGTFLQDNTTLMRLTLDGNAIGNEGLKQLVMGLLHQSVVVSLSVANCGITDAVCIARTRLKQVNLRGNDIDDCAALDLLRSLGPDCSVEWLCLCDNKITERGGEALARSVAPTTVLEYM